MPGELIPIIIVPSFFFCIAYITQVISDNRIRREFISKNVSADIIQKLFVDKRAESVSGNLKWGVVMVAVGFALSIIHLARLSADEPLTYSIVFILAGGGFLLYYVFQTFFIKAD